MKPQQRKDALARSDEIIKQLQEAQQDGKQSIDHLLNNDKPQTEAQDAKAEEGKSDGQAQPPADTQEPATTGDQPSSSSDNANGDLKAQYDKLEHAHRVLQGKYNAEIQPLHEEIRQLRKKATDLEEALATKEKKQETPKEIEGLTLEQVEEKLYDEFPSDIAKILAASMKASLAGRPDEALVERLNRLEGMTQEQLFMQRLEQRIPDWRKVQQHPQWIPYLQERNPESGLERNDHLQEARAKGDLDRIVAIFDGFRSRIQQAPKQSTDEPLVEAQSRSGAPPASPDAKRFTPQEINAFYSQLNSRQLDIRDPKVRALRDSIEEFLAQQQKAS